MAIVQHLVPQYRLPLFESLARQSGLAVTVVADLKSGDPGSEGVGRSNVCEFQDSPASRIGPFVRQDGAIAAARDPRFDVVVFEWSSRRYQLPAAVREAHRSGKGVVLWGHGSGTTAPWLGNWMRDRMVPWADACVLYGNSARDELLRRGVPSGKLFVAPNAIDQSATREAVRYWRTSDRLVRFRSDHGIVGVPLLIYISRLEPEKRPEMVVEVLARLRSRHQDMAAVFIGSGSARSRVERLADEYGVADAVRLLGATYDEMQIAPWAMSGVCLVHPERIGLTILHAFGYGLPVITSDDRSRHGPEAEVLEPGINGLLYRRRDVDDLAAKVKALVTDEELRMRMSANAARVVSGGDGRGLPTMVAGLSAAISAAAQRGVARAPD